MMAGMNARIAPAAPPGSDLGTRRHIGSLVRRAQQRHAALWAESVSTRVSSVQYATLETIDRLPGASQRDLGEELGLDRSTIADLVQRMERAGLLLRRRDAADRRRNTLELSAAGAAELEALRPAVDAVQLRLVEGLDAAEAAELRRLLLRLIGE